jgi:hypothetical protein
MMIFTLAVWSANLLRNFISFYHHGLPRSGMAFSPKFSLHIWLAKLTLFRGTTPWPLLRYYACWS